MPQTVAELTTQRPAATGHALPWPPRSQSSASLLATLVLKEVHDLVLTLRFMVGTVLALGLAVMAAYIGSLDYNARLDSYQTKLKLTRDAIAETRVYSFLRPTIYRPPEPLSVLNRGLEGRLGTDYWVSIDVENTEAEGQNRGNEYLAIFSEVDLTVVVAVILGLLALLFTFDSVSGEREGGNAEADHVVRRVALAVSARQIPGRLADADDPHGRGLRAFGAGGVDGG
jgi:hypothetical protein